MKLSVLLVVIGAVIGVNLIFLGARQHRITQGAASAGGDWDAAQYHAAAGGPGTVATTQQQHQQQQQQPSAAAQRRQRGLPVAPATLPRRLPPAVTGPAGAPLAELRCVDWRAAAGGPPCHSWRCGRDPDTRYVRCKASCGSCAALQRAIAADAGVRVAVVVRRLSRCRDAGKECAAWLAADAKRCSTDAARMLQLCQATCGFCNHASSSNSIISSSNSSSRGDGSSKAAAGAGTAAATAAAAQWPGDSGGALPCVDDVSLCPYFRQRGLCGGGSAWADTQCRLSCGVCAPSSGASNATGSSSSSGGGAGGGGSEPIVPLTALTSAQDPAACRDYHAQCAAWAAAGVCRTNPSFMNLHCKASCKTCAPAGTAQPQPQQQQNQQHNQPNQQHPQVFSNQPPRPPPPPARPPPPPPDPNVGTEWQPFWLCGASVAAAEAPMDCAKLEEVQLDDCADAAPECERWADAGECERNAGGVVPLCRDSCDACSVYTISAPYEYLILGPPGNVEAERKYRRRLEAGDGGTGDDDEEEQEEGGDEDKDDMVDKKDDGEDEEDDEGDGDDDDDDKEELLVGMPAVGFGTAGLGDRTTDAVAAALAAGYELIDTAEAREWYRQDLVGEALRRSGRPREAVFLVSKLHPKNHGADAARAAFDRTLAELGTDFLDLWLIHYPECAPAIAGCAKGGAKPQGTWRNTWRVMEELHRAGRVRAIGVSNFSPAQLEELLDLADVKPAVVQARADPLDAAPALLPMCLERGLAFVAYSALGTQWEAEAGARGGGAKNPVLEHPKVKAVAASIGRTPAQVVLRWALQRGMGVIPRSARPDHMRENLAVFDFELSDDHMAALNGLDGQRPDGAKGPAAARGPLPPPARRRR